MHKGDKMTMEEVFQTVCMECGLNGRAYTEEEEDKVINKIGEMICVTRWIEVALTLHHNNIFPYARVRGVLEPQMPFKMYECLKKECPAITPMALNLLSAKHDTVH